MPTIRHSGVRKRLPHIMRAIVFGVQGSGKGTQADLIAKRFRAAHITTGEIFRQEIERRTALGNRVRARVDSGTLVSDSLTNAMVAKRLRRSDARQAGFVLDGYPRNRNQLRALLAVTPISCAIEIRLPDREAVRRIAGRRSCVCGMIYHVQFQPPRRAGFCDACGRRLFIRHDDRPAVIRRRIRDYHRQTAPLLEYFRRRGLLVSVDGRPSIAQVFLSIRAILALRRKARSVKRKT